MKIQLILPPVDERYHRLSPSRCFAPLGLTSVATYLEQELSPEQLEILDGELLPQTEILSRLSADVVGISVSILSYHNSVEMMRQAKANGSVVVVGGHHATAMPE